MRKWTSLGCLWTPSGAHRSSLHELKPYVADLLCACLLMLTCRRNSLLQAQAQLSALLNDISRLHSACGRCFDIPLLPSQVGRNAAYNQWHLSTPL
jgi:hypothetical protein